MHQELKRPGVALVLLWEEYATTTPRQTTADWIGAPVQAPEFVGGVPRLIVPDQTCVLIKTPDRYDPEPNRRCAGSRLATALGHLPVLACGRLGAGQLMILTCPGSAECLTPT